MDAAKILANVCSDERPSLTEPMQFEVDGVMYAAATDGFVAVMFRGVDVPVTVGQLSADRIFEVLIPDTIDVAVMVTMADLQAVAGPHAYGDTYPCDECKGKPESHTRPCEPCDGTGEVDCECECGDVHTKDCEACEGKKTIVGCDKCDGDGEVAYPFESVWINCRWFDKRLIAEVVRDMPTDGNVTLTLSGDNMGLWGDGWAAVIMAMRETEKAVPTEAWPFPCGEATAKPWEAWQKVRRAAESGK